VTVELIWPRPVGPSEESFVPQQATEPAVALADLRHDRELQAVLLQLVLEVDHLTPAPTVTRWRARSGSSILEKCVMNTTVPVVSIDSLSECSSPTARTGDG